MEASLGAAPGAGNGGRAQGAPRPGVVSRQRVARPAHTGIQSSHGGDAPAPARWVGERCCARSGGDGRRAGHLGAGHRRHHGGGLGAPRRAGVPRRRGPQHAGQHRRDLRHHAGARRARVGAPPAGARVRRGVRTARRPPGGDRARLPRRCRVGLVAVAVARDVARGLQQRPARAARRRPVAHHHGLRRPHPRVRRGPLRRRARRAAAHAPSAAPPARPADPRRVDLRGHARARPAPQLLPRRHARRAARPARARPAARARGARAARRGGRARGDDAAARPQLVDRVVRAARAASAPCSSRGCAARWPAVR